MTTTETVKKMIMELKQLDSLDNDARLIEARILDSFDLITLVMQLETEFGVSIDGGAISPESFADVASIAAMIDGLKGA
jgi:acyl carrier protein